MKKDNGITLIALVITIIVMLILVVVTIRIATDGKLFDYAGEAAKKTQEEADKEKELSNGNINGQSIEDIVNKALSTSETTSEEIKKGSSEKASKV